MTASSVRVRKAQIRHTPETGTTITGTKPGDGSWSVLTRGRVAGCWWWNRDRQCWEAHGSHGQQVANHDLVIVTDRALSAIGFDVDTLIQFPQQ